jgi:regulator of sigma E protease
MFVEGSAAEVSGMRIGDRLVKIGAAPIRSWRDIPGEVEQSRGSPIEIVVERLAKDTSATENSTENSTEDQTLLATMTVTPKFSEERQRWMIGIGEGSRIVQYSLPQAVTLGTEQLYNISRAVFLFLGRCITFNCSFAALGGPLKIAEYSGKAARLGVVPLLTFMAIISLQLGLLNLLPIPALDGGHIFFLGLEGLNRGPLSQKFRERSQLVGLTLLIMLMVTVILNDIVQMFSGGGSG